MFYELRSINLWTGVLISHSEEIPFAESCVNRYVSKLAHNVEKGLKEMGISAKVSPNGPRIFVETRSIEEALNIIGRVFGVAYAAPCIQVECDRVYDTVSFMLEKLLKQGFSPIVKVRFIGCGSLFDLDEKVQLLSQAKHVSTSEKLGKPIKINVEVVKDVCYVYTDSAAGPRGLPIGISSRVVCLVSGGIDSPVASWMMMKRGCPIIVLFAYFPMGGDESDLKRLIEVVKRLRRWHIGVKMPVYIYRHDHNLVAFRKAAPRFTCVLCRRMMYRVANELADVASAKAIVTGENLGQVASQTLQNLNVIDQASKLPVLRPLIGFNKEEIVRIAKDIGTYKASCMRVSSGCAPVKGCWARPSKPATRAKLNTILKIESKLDVKTLLKRSVESIKEIPVEWFTSAHV